MYPDYNRPVSAFLLAAPRINIQRLLSLITITYVYFVAHAGGNQHDHDKYRRVWSAMKGGHLLST
jgi:hypothetical protein